MIQLQKSLQEKDALIKSLHEKIEQLNSKCSQLAQQLEFAQKNVSHKEIEDLKHDVEILKKENVTIAYNQGVNSRKGKVM